MILQICIILPIFLYLVFRWKNRHLFELANRLHTSCIGPVLPVVGQSYFFRGDSEDRMNALLKLSRLTTEKGGVLAVWQSFKLGISISDAEIIDIVLKTFIEKEDLMEYLTIFYGNGSIFTPAKIWRPRRKATAPIFNQKNLRNFTTVFSHQSEVLVGKLHGSVDKGPFALLPFMNAYALDSICESTFGVTVNAQSGGNHPFPTAFLNLTKIQSDLFFKPYLQNRTIYKIYSYLMGAIKNSNVMCNFVDNILNETRQKLEQMKLEQEQSESDETLARKDIPTFMELFMQSLGAGRKLTELELREEAIVLVTAASDTTAVGVSFAAMLLARHPEVQEKVYKELQEVLGKTIRSVNYEDLPRLKYLEAVIKETLRMYPPVALVLRKADTDLTLPTGVTLLKGCTIVANVIAVQRNPKYWGDDADSFKPERFLDTPPPQPAAYMPFGYGPRNCVGFQYAMMSMKIVMGTILQHYQILPAEHSPEPGLKSPHDEATNPLRLYFSFMVKEVSNFTVKMKSR